ncbi:MAG TPA: succinate dehydrogenase, cytochrome b556 subunit [Acetobacteraceae bacterium]|nr:succinate dehydrogenase, cytochrome b556 subunit [Acetobacteraceae bacterium]
MAGSPIHDSRDATYVGRRTDGTLVRRPMSPHLQAYDMWQMTSALSIAHRITGVIWAVGLVFLVWWLVAAAAGPQSFANAQWFFGGPIGWLVLIGLTAAAWYHTLNGIRHLVWDMGMGFGLPDMYRSGYMVLVGTAALTALTVLLLAVFWWRA